MRPAEALALVHGDLAGIRDVRISVPDGPISLNLHVTADSALETVERGVLDRRNVYVGIATRRDPNGGGGKSNLLSVRTLWVDRDFHGEADVRAHERALAGFLLPPSLRVNSGGGEHDYWLLEQPPYSPTRRRRCRPSNMC